MIFAISVMRHWLGWENNPFQTRSPLRWFDHALQAPQESTPLTELDPSPLHKAFIYLASVDGNLYLMKISIHFNNWLYWHHERPELVTDED